MELEERTLPIYYEELAKDFARNFQRYYLHKPNNGNEEKVNRVKKQVSLYGAPDKILADIGNRVLRHLNIAGYSGVKVAFNVKEGYHVDLSWFLKERRDVSPPFNVLQREKKISTNNSDL